MKRREYGRQQNNTLTNSMNNIPIDTSSPPRQCLKPNLVRPIKMGTQDRTPRII
jgi:hypothetical protein